MRFLRFLSVAIRAYRRAQRCDTAYAAYTVAGVPQIAVYVGLGREAWRVSHIAIESFEVPR